MNPISRVFLVSSARSIFFKGSLLYSHRIPGKKYMLMEEMNWVFFQSILAILQWWGFNITVIIMNKWIFQKLDFMFPLIVSCIHFICSAVGAYIAIKLLTIKPLIEVDPEDRWRRKFPMSFVFCINIVLGNWLAWRKHFDWCIWTSLVPIVGGILLTSITELSFNMFGFCAQRHFWLSLFFMDINLTVYYMAPFATMILAIPAVLLEGAGVFDWFYTHEAIFSAMIIIISSGVLFFCLNFFIFYVIHSTTAVTFNVAGNLKVAVAVLASWLIFENPISAMNALGCAVTLSGCTFYGYVRHRLSQQLQSPGTSRTP